MLKRLLTWPALLGAPILDAVLAIGDTVLLFLQGAVSLVLPRYRPANFIDQLEFAGVRSLPIVMLTAAFTGMVFSLQSLRVFQTFNVETVVGATVTLAITRELAPVLTGLMVSGRVGSAMATEIGTMRVTEQIDAMEAMAVDPVHYLFAPRIWAGALMLPLLTLYFDVVGVGGAWLVAVRMGGVDQGFFLGNIRRMVDVDDALQGVIKAAVFGAIIAAVACRQGVRASGGARGVGAATTSAVVWSSVSILTANYLLTLLIF